MAFSGSSLTAPPEGEDYATFIGLLPGELALGVTLGGCAAKAHPPPHFPDGTET